MTNPIRPKPVVLVILDGWGIAPPNAGNAITLSQTPTMNSFYATYPHASLEAAGEFVGLPRGEDGNTETGHLNLGAGQIVYQDLPRINQAIADGSFQKNPALNSAINHAKTHQSTLHIMGLVGSGGVHSSIDHLFAIIAMCQSQSLSQFALHLITDGRDSPPTSGINYIRQIKDKLKILNVGKIATIIGRYYAMDRDHRWERTEIAYKAMTQGVGTKTNHPEDAVLLSYDQKVTDEFIKPIIVTDNEGRPNALVKENDAVIFFNFRIDRPRQLTKAFVYPNFEYVANQKDGFDPHAIKYYKSHLVQAPRANETVFDRGPLIKNLLFVTMTEYEQGLPVSIAFPPVVIDMPLGRVVAEMGLRQLRMSETEKERFVTFYFNGQRDDPFPGEDRIIIPSPPVATYDQKPEMSSRELTQTLIERIETSIYDFVVINYANPDMVGHTGNLAAGIKAIEITDTNLKRLADTILAQGGAMIITADHGNVEEMINLENGAIDTEHSTNPVPCLIISAAYQAENRELPRGILADVAPTILKIMDLPKPSSMSGQSLI
jgi:2,3-bisphosphoglycerate-independent phosphoglycerate mutase